jgi:uncharacterized protein YjbI with pentapeptide repeats
MAKRDPKERPISWREERQTITAAWIIPFRRFNWAMAWTSWALSHWALLDVLDHLGRFSILIAVVFYFADSGNRVKQRHYQAWQVINTAQSKGGSGGRIDALQELNSDHVSLIGVDASGAFLSGIHLAQAHLERCDLHEADLRQADLNSARLKSCNVRGANLRQADLTSADLSSTELQDADLNQANLTGANLADADMSRADLRFADVRNLDWKSIQSMQLANIYGLKNAPADFLAFAKAHAAVSLQSDDDWNVLLRKAAADAK